MKKAILISFLTGLAAGAILMLFQQVTQKQHKLMHNERINMEKTYVLKMQGGPEVEHKTYLSAVQETERLTRKYRKNTAVYVKIAECRPAPDVIWEGEPQEVEE